MGGGNWTSASFTNYSASLGRDVMRSATTGRVVLDSCYDAQDIFTSRGLNEALNPRKAIRECCDSEEHPNTIPVILALDVTGSMGKASAEVAKKLNEIMEQLFEKVKDVEFMTMAIGDLAYDRAPIQASQFESDIRIAEQLDKVYFEGGGGGNGFESYTAAWYFGLHNTKLDCHKRGKKGIIITMGDEPMNPYLPVKEMNRVLGSNAEADIGTANLYDEVIDKFDVYHLVVDDPESSASWYDDRIDNSWGKYLDKDHLIWVKLDNIAPTICNIVEGLADGSNSGTVTLNENQEISW